MAAAIKAAINNRDPILKSRHGAVVESGGRIISRGKNSFKARGFFRPRAILGICSRHAEVDAILRAGKSARGSDLYVARVSKSLKEVLSKPCADCAAFIARAGIRKVYYT